MMFKTNAVAEPVLSVLLDCNRTLLCIITEYVQALQNATHAFIQKAQCKTISCTLSLSDDQ